MGFLDNIKGFFGTQPGAIQAGGSTPTSGSGGFLGNLQQAPVQGAPTSFLDRLGTEDSRGRTFGDKLFAAGQIAQGQDPSSFLQNRQAVSDQERQIEEAKARQAKLSQVMAASMGPDDQINPRTLMQGAAGIGGGVDIDTMLKLQKANEDQWSPMSAGSDVVMGNKRTGQFGSTYHGVQKPGLLNPDGTINYDFINAGAAQAGAKAKAVAPYRPKPQGRQPFGSHVPPGATPGLPQ
jgi:hypothetical protein